MRLAAVVGAGLLAWPCHAQPTLAEALDDSGLSWSTGGDLEWFGIEDSNAHDGVDAAQSGDVDNAQLSWVQTTLTGPGLMSFWWNVSSEEFFDVLEVVVNGQVWGEISGEQTWAESTLDLPEGEVTVRWQYRKDESYSQGDDNAWLDSVAFVSTPVLAPAILTQPRDGTVTSESDASLSVEISGTETLHYQWRLNGTNVVEGPHFSGTTGRVINLIQVQTNQAGQYSVTVSNSAGGVLSSNAWVTVNPPVSLADALDTTGWIWLTGGDRVWAGQQTLHHDGVDAAQSGAITDLQQTWTETTVEGPGVIRFWWKVSSEESFDKLQFLVDGFVEGEISGEVDWTEAEFSIPAGTHNLRWVYGKDLDTLGGQDLAWLDEVSFLAHPQATAYPISQSARRGDTVVLLSIVSGSPPLGLQWTRDSLAVPGATNSTLTLTDVKRADSGAYALTATNAIGSAVSSNAVVTVHVPQQLHAPVRQSDGTLLLSSRDVDGGSIQPEHLGGFSAWASSNLITWEPLPASLLGVSNGWLLLHDTNAAAFAQRFYQIREP